MPTAAAVQSMQSRGYRGRASRAANARQKSAGGSIATPAVNLSFSGSVQGNNFERDCEPRQKNSS